ncbi:MAG: HD domain-containing protein [Candidatus Latescibacterota bacterium]
MHSETFQSIRAWLKSYIDRFLAEDGTVKEIVQLKWIHSLWVASHCRDIAEELGWDSHDIAVAELLGLLHDAGRFSQFSEFGTFMDSASVNHGERGVEVVRAAGVLDALAERDRMCILEGIVAHNRRGISPETPPDALPFVKLVRDADKLDIYRIVMERIAAGAYHEHLRSALQIDREGPATPGAVDEILRNETVSNGNIRTMADFGLMQISWVFDINYPSALHRILAQGYIERIARCLPDSPDVRGATEHVLSFVTEGTESARQ